MGTVAPVTGSGVPRNVRVCDDEHPVFHVEQIRHIGQNGRPSEKRFGNHAGVGENDFVGKPGFWIRGRTIRSPGLQTAKRSFLDGVGANGMVHRFFANRWRVGVVVELSVRLGIDAQTNRVGVFHAVRVVGWVVVVVVFPRPEIVVHHWVYSFRVVCYCAHEIKRFSLRYVFTWVTCQPGRIGEMKKPGWNYPPNFVLFIHLTNTRLPARAVALFFCPLAVGLLSKAVIFTPSNNKQRNMDLPFTHIYEWAKRKMRLSRDEYALCNYIATWSAYPGSTRLGWCDRTLQQKADFIDITPRGLTKMQNRMIEIELVEKDSLTSHVRTTIAWWETINEAKDRELCSQQHREQSSHDQGTKFRKHREQSSHDTGNKVPTHNNDTLFNQNNDFIVIDGDAKIVTPIETVVDFLNRCLNPARPFSATTKKTVESINARLQEKYTVAEICLVIEHKVSEWKGDDKMEQYIRPATLFGKEKFEGYLVAATNWQAKGKPSKIKNGHNGNNGFAKSAPHVADDATSGAFKNG